MKTFVTGGTGFIGKRVVRKLIERGDQVTCLVRSQEGAQMIKALGARPVWGDITAVESMRSGMQGSEIVFHIAGWYKLGSADQTDAAGVNIDGTRNVLSLAHELGVPRIIYTSSIAAYGDTRGKIVNETFPQPDGPFLSEYDRTKSYAYFQVARPLIESGAPVITVMPGVVFGPGDPSLFGEMMRFFYKGFFIVLPGPELTLTFAHVDDVAEGHLLAADKGRIGESYLLCGPILTLAEVVDIWAHLSGKRQPLFNIPARIIKPLAPLAAILQKIPSMPGIISEDAVNILEATLIARSDKARQELGWTTRPLEAGMRQTFAWLAGKPSENRFSPYPLGADKRRKIALVAVGSAIGLLAAWLLLRRKQ